MIALLANWKRILYGTALATVGLIALVQTARIEGFLIWDGLKAENTELRDTISGIKEAQEQATKLAIAEKKRIEELNRKKADEAKRDYENRLAANDAALRKWLRSQAGRATGNPDLSSQSQASSGTDGAGGVAFVPEGHALVPIRDLELSAQAFAKLEAWQAWGRSIHQGPPPD